MNLVLPEGERRGGPLRSSEACPACGSYDNAVRDSRRDQQGRRRRRRCNNCHAVWRTIEVDMTLVVNLAAVVGRLDDVTTQISVIRELLKSTTPAVEEVETEEG